MSMGETESKDEMVKENDPEQVFTGSIPSH